MRYFKQDIGSDELCLVILDALKSGPKSSRELLSICKEKYSKFWEEKHGFKKAIVSYGEIHYRVRRLLKDGLIARDSDGNYTVLDPRAA